MACGSQLAYGTVEGKYALVGRIILRNEDEHRMKINRMLITGAAGMVGSYVPEVFEGIELTLTDIEGQFLKLDVRNLEDVMNTVRETRPDVVVHLAAATDVDCCEQDPDWAYQTNTLGTQNVAMACQSYGAVMVYIGTAGVFWGDKPEPYTEFDDPRPANIYGHSKLHGERSVSSLLQKHYIVRAGWMIGGGRKDKKFVGKIVRLMLNGACHIRAVDDKFGSPTYAKDLLQGIRRLLDIEYYGLYHMVNVGNVSRYQVALAIAGILGRTDIEVEPVSSAHFPLPAPRARSEAMRNYKLELMGLDQPRAWHVALEEYLTQELLPDLQAETKSTLHKDLLDAS